MQRHALVAGLLVASAALAGDDPAANKEALARLQGDWKMVRALTGGRQAPEEKVARTVLTIEGDRMSIQDKGKERREEAVIKIDVRKKPHSIDILPVEKDSPAVRGIFKLDRDTLTIVFARRGGERPTEFTSPPDAQISLLELERKKK